MSKKTKYYLIKKFPKFMQKKLVLLYVGVILVFTILVFRITYINASRETSTQESCWNSGSMTAGSFPISGGYSGL